MKIFVLVDGDDDYVIPVRLLATDKQLPVELLMSVIRTINNKKRKGGEKGKWLIPSEYVLVKGRTTHQRLNEDQPLALQVRDLDDLSLISRSSNPNPREKSLILACWTTFIHNLLDENEFSQAEREATFALQFEKTSVLFELRAISLLLQGQRKSASADFQAAIDLDNRNYKATCFLGAMHFAVGNFSRAVGFFDLAISSFPKEKEGKEGEKSISFVESIRKMSQEAKNRMKKTERQVEFADQTERKKEEVEKKKKAEEKKVEKKEEPKKETSKEAAAKQQQDTVFSFGRKSNNKQQQETTKPSSSSLLSSSSSPSALPSSTSVLVYDERKPLGVASHPALSAWLEKSKKTANELREKGMLKQASSAYSQITAIAGVDFDCWRGLASIAFQNRDYQLSLDYYCKIIALGGGGGGGGGDRTSFEDVLNAGGAAVLAGDGGLALMFFDRAAEFLAKRGGGDLETANRVKLSLAQAMTLVDHQNAAASLLQDLVEGGGAEGGGAVAGDILLEFGRAYRERGELTDAIRVYLRVLVSRSKDPIVRQEFTSLVNSAEGGVGLEILLSELSDAASSPPALAFLATLVKDYGAVHDAVFLYEKALKIQNNNSAYILNLVHTIEVLNQYDYAFQTLSQFCRQNPLLGCGNLKAKQIFEIISKVEDISDPKHRGDVSQPRVAWRPNFGALVIQPGEQIPQEAEHGANVLPPPPTTNSPLPSPAAKDRTPPYSTEELDMLALFFTILKIAFVAGAVDIIPPLIELIEPYRRPYELHTTTIRNEHAYYCCVAQLMEFVQLPIPPPPPPLASSSSSDDNEEEEEEISPPSSSLPAVLPTPLPPKQKIKDVFSNSKKSVRYSMVQLHMVGDSHSLSSAWQRMNVKKKIANLFMKGNNSPSSSSSSSLGANNNNDDDEEMEEVLLVPKLVTGLKCYHLREESVFFPKNNFYNVVKSIPRSSAAVFMFGEIDCREGIIKASEHKGLYKSIEDGCASTVDVYLNVLEELIDEYDFKIFVQPVPPVLNETREVVTIFTKILKQRVEQFHPRLTFLDGVFEKMITPEGKLDPQYELDGTHLHPRYVRLLEASFNAM